MSLGETHCSHNKRSCSAFNLTVKSFAIPNRFCTTVLPKSHFPSLPHALFLSSCYLPCLRHLSCKTLLLAFPLFQPPFRFHIVSENIHDILLHLFHHLIETSVYILLFDCFFRILSRRSSVLFLLLVECVRGEFYFKRPCRFLFLEPPTLFLYIWFSTFSCVDFSFLRSEQDEQRGE